MKPLIEYNSKCLNAMYDYLQDGQLSKLVETLEEAEDHAISEMGKDRYGECLWFKFSHDDTLATDIVDLESTLRYGTIGNKEHLLECMEYACKNNTLEVYFS